MNDQLKEFVDKNLEAFDTFEPSSKVWSAVYKKTHKRNVWVLPFLKYAAAVLIFAAGFALGTRYYKPAESEHVARFDKQKLEEQSKLIESEYYYTTEINERLVSLEPYFASDPQLKKDVDFDFEELDKFYTQLKKDLKDDINNEHVIEAMIQSYQMKLELLETLLQQLKKPENEKIKHDI